MRHDPRLSRSARNPSARKSRRRPNACDTHAHVFGPGARFAYAETRSYTPPDAPLEKYLHMLDTLGFARGGLVQGSAHGRDNSAMLDALERSIRTACAASRSPTRPCRSAELRRWNDLGIRALRFNHFFRDGKLHYRAA